MNIQVPTPAQETAKPAVEDQEEDTNAKSVEQKSDNIMKVVLRTEGSEKKLRGRSEQLGVE